MLNDSRQSEDWCDKGCDACDQGDFATALQCFDQAERCDATSKRVHYERGVTLERMGDSAAAQQCYRNCLASWPDHDMALSNLGSLLREQGKFAEAIAELDKAVRANPAREEAWFHKGMCHRSLGRLDAAATCLERAVRINPTDADNWHWLGVIMQELERFREALVCFSAARRYSRKPSQLQQLIHRSGMCGQRAATGDQRDPAAYRVKYLALVPSGDRRQVLQTIADDFANAIEFLGRSGNHQAVELVRQEVERLVRDLSTS